MWKLLIILFFGIYFLYIATLLLHICEAIVITYRRITFKRAIIPFYYWIAPMNEPKNTNNKTIKTKNNGTN